MMLLLALLACGPDRFEPEARALDRFQAGRALLERGDAAAAVEALTAAAEADPGSAELQLWRGRALAAAGRLPEAVDAASAALARRPGWGLALYNRACWRSRAGALDEAVVDLEAALRTGEVDRFTVALDPDLDGLRVSPVHAGRLPAARLPLEVEQDEQPAFLGARWAVTLRTEHPAGPAPSLALLGAEPAALSLIELREEVFGNGRLTARTLTVAFRVGAAGEGLLGPWRVGEGRLEGESAPAPFRFLAPEGHSAPPAPPVAPLVGFPSAQLDGIPVPGAVRRGDRVWVRGEPGDVVVDLPEDAVLLEVREDGRVSTLGWTWPAPADTVVRLSRGRATVLEQSL